MVRCSGVRKGYDLGGRRVEALKGVDLSIERAGFYAIMGASGSGKSTLLHLLAGIDGADAGEIEVGGQRLDTMRERDLTQFRRTGVGIVFQQFNLIPTMTARDNVELPGVIAGMDGRELRARSGELLGRLGMSDRASHRPEALSGGEQQRVAIARALVFEPPVVLADEPTGNLDSASSAKLWALLGELASERRITVVMVTHELEAASRCEEVFVLKDGISAGSIRVEGTDGRDVAAEYQRLLGSA